MACVKAACCSKARMPSLHGELQSEWLHKTFGDAVQVPCFGEPWVKGRGGGRWGAVQGGRDCEERYMRFQEIRSEGQSWQGRTDGKKCRGQGKQEGSEERFRALLPGSAESDLHTQYDSWSGAFLLTRRSTTRLSARNSFISTADCRATACL